MDRMRFGLKLIALSLMVSAVVYAYNAQERYSVFKQYDCGCSETGGPTKFIQVGHDARSKSENGSLENTQPETFTHDMTGCKIQIYTNKTLIFEDREKFSSSSRVCTPQTFQDYARQNLHFHSDGRWYSPETGSPKGAKFFPEDCLFDEESISAGNLSDCFPRKDIRRILVLGDSNAYYLHLQLLEHLRRKSINCDLKREEGSTVGRKFDGYFDIPGMQTVQKFKGCARCFSRLHHCSDTDNRSTKNRPLTIEFIGTLHILDRRLQKSNAREDILRDTILEQETFMEFLFQRYFPHYGFPDLWIFPAPMLHEAETRTTDELRRDIRDFQRLIHKYLPVTTRLVIMTNVRDCPSPMSEDVKLFYKKHSMVRNEVMHRMNHMLFEILKDDFLSPNTNILGFLDQGVIGCPVTCIWHRDGAHMVDGWYDIMIQNIFSLICTDK